MKITLMFPGQGSQAVGMGKDLYDKFPTAKNMIDRAGDIVKFDIRKAMFEGPADLLQRTDKTQPTVFLVSAVCHAILKEHGINADFTAGNSLGEYGALVCSGVLTFEEALEIVNFRGQFMNDAAQKYPGAMAAIMGLADEAVADICKQASNGKKAVPALFNSPGQIVISGDTEAVSKAGELAAARGATKVVPLKVSGAWHSHLMKEAEDRLSAVLDRFEFRKPQIPVYANVTAQPVTDAAEIKRALRAQLCYPVKWLDSMKGIIAQGADTFIEAGPGRVLCGILRSIDKTLKFANVEDEKSLQDAKTKLGL